MEKFVTNFQHEEVMLLEISWIVTIFAIGLIGSFLSGMLGIGGAIIKFPMLLYIPPLLGFTAFTSHQVTGISSIEVVFASLAGVLAYKGGKYLNKTLILTMGVGIVIGSLCGSFTSSYLSEQAVNVVYGILAIIAAILMFLPNEKKSEDQPVYFNKTIAFTLAIVSGIASGIVGAGGGFIIVPVMLVFLKIPLRMTIASSLAITFISSIGGSVGKIATGQVEWVPAIVMIIASLIAAPLGAKFSKKMSQKTLKIVLATLIVITALKIWSDILF